MADSVGRLPGSHKAVPSSPLDVLHSLGVGDPGRHLGVLHDGNYVQQTRRRSGWDDADMISAATPDPLAPTRLTGGQWVRAVGNVLNLTTPLGLLIARIGRARVRRGPRGLLLAEGYRLPFPIAGAFTVGSVITTGTTFADRLRGLPSLLEHEERHSWQYLCCLGLPFYPVYVVMMGWSVLRTGNRAARNAFERHAGLAAGGYPDLPVIPLSVQARRATGWLRRSLGSRDSRAR